MKKSFFIDLDDTITPTGYRYSQVVCEFCYYLYEQLDRNAPFVYDLVLLQQETDLKLIKKYGFFKTRFPHSFVLTYREVCKRAGLSPKKEVEKKVKEIGKKVYDMSYYKKNFIEGVEETLEFLVSKQDSLTLLTMGDKEIQLGKVRALGLEKYFQNNLLVVPEKIQATYKKLLKEQENTPYMIGDSFRSDIVPSVKSGWNAIYIPMPGGTWSYDKKFKQELTKEEWDRVIKLRNFKEIKEKYDIL
ncbi:HAD family hydrolase [archaeon]|nr:HAD family hydrolase [archaeon]